MRKYKHILASLFTAIFFLYLTIYMFHKQHSSGIGITREKNGTN